VLRLNTRPETGAATILVGTGNYHETVNITRTGSLTLLVSEPVQSLLLPISASQYIQGQLDKAHLNSTFNNTVTPTRNLVHIWNNAFATTGLDPLVFLSIHSTDACLKLGMDDAQSAVLIVAPSFNASLIGGGPTGASLQPLFGTTDFKAYNIDFENQAVSPQ
jgi:hypothetical protein